MRIDALKLTLNNIYNTYHKPELIKTDPVACVRRFKSAQEREIAGLLASSLAYGRVERIMHSIDTVFDVMGRDILSFVHATSFAEKKRLLRGFKHRFNSGADIATLLEAVKMALQNYGSLEKMFCGQSCRDDTSIKKALSAFTHILKGYGARITGAERQPSFEFLVPSPQSGGACKRMNMYLRWMVRRDDRIDCGAWKSVSPATLIMPVDVHVARVARRLRMSQRRTADWKMAEEITGVLKKIAPADPVKYDFSLYKYGMNIMRLEKTDE